MGQALTAAGKFEIEICDLEVTRRKVELPLRCPACGADFSDPDGDGLKVAEFQDQTRKAVVERADVDDGDDATYLDWPDLPESGDSFVQVSVACGACDAVLAQGKETSHGG